MIAQQAVGRIFRPGMPGPKVHAINLAAGIPTAAEILATKRAAARPAAISLRRNMRMQRILQACLDLDPEVQDALAHGETVIAIAKMGCDLRYRVQILAREPEAPRARPVGSKLTAETAGRAADMSRTRRARRAIGEHTMRIELHGPVGSASVRAIGRAAAESKARHSAKWLRRSLKLNTEILLGQWKKKKHGSEDP